MLSRLTTLIHLLPAAILATTALGQDVRELSVPTGQHQFLNVTAATITATVNTGFRVVDVEYSNGSGSASRFNATLVANTGAYAASWWWYFGMTTAQLNAQVAANNGRLIDLESYVDSNGIQRFACVMVSNTGANAKTWWYYYDTSVATLSQQVTANNARLVDLDSYQVGGTTYYLGVMIRNTGADARSWWWYINQSTAQITNQVNANQARLYDLDRNSNGGWDCIMIQDVAPTGWYWWTGLRAQDVGYLINNYGVRPIDVESYFNGLFVRYSMLTVNNVNALTTAVGNTMRATTNGQVGCWLQQINGPNLANLNGSTQFEPASTMKTLHHVHAMRRVNLGAVSLTQPINVFTNYSSTNLSCPIDTGPITEPLTIVLRDMMENSDNARTQAVTAYFGQASINATAAALGMSSTSLNHRLGCSTVALANPNQITLRDLHQLHAQVANGYLGSFRDTFYELMLDSIADLSINTMITQEASGLGLSQATRNSFRSFTKLAHKGGNYGLSSGGPQYFHRAEFGWLSLPFISNGVITPREYGFGLFVNDAPNDALASTAIYAQGIPELLRETVRAALQSWVGNLANSQLVGPGCGTPTFTQVVQSLPRINTSQSFFAQNAYANALGAFVLGTSSTLWGAVPLPAPLASIGGEPGCMAYNDPVSVEVFVASAGGLASTSFSIPNNVALIGFEYFSQFWSFDTGAIKTSQSFRHTVGL